MDADNIVSARMYYQARGVTEFVGGYWNPDLRAMQLQRYLGNNINQWYALWEGTHVAGHPVFGGYFQQDDQAGSFGVFANNFVPASASPGWTPYPGWNRTLPVCWTGCAVPSPPHGRYAFDGNGWSGELDLTAGSSIAFLKFDDYGYWELVGASWDATSRTLLLNRQIGGGATQTYHLCLGDGPGTPMLGGYFSESDVNGGNGGFSAFALPLSL